MKNRVAPWLLLFVFALTTTCPTVRAQIQPQTPAQKTKQPSWQSSTSDAQKKNIQAYVELMRTNVRQQKAEILGSVMQLSADDAAKFWPIYSEYNAELTKVNNLRVENIQDYAQNYNHMTDEKADQLILNALEYRKQRSELLAKYYGQVKQSLGAVTAARFLQVEDQLLLIVDLQIDASLPIVGE
jgi:hypothetical protein